MSIIEGLGPSSPGRLADRTRRANDTRFSLPGAAQPPGPATAEASAPVVAAGMLALQELGVEAPQDRAARRHGRALLAALSRLQRQLLGATDTGDALDTLADLVTSVPRATDPGVAAALDAVALRVRVELARRGR